MLNNSDEFVSSTNSFDFYDADVVDFLVDGENTVAVKVIGTSVRKESEYCAAVSFNYTKTVPVVTLSVAVSGSSTVVIGEKITMTAVVTASDSSAVSQDVVWSLSSGRATIEQNGELTGVSAGQVTVTATAAGTSYKGTKVVTVSYADVQSVSAITGGADVRMGETLQLGGAEVVPSNANQAITWSSSDTDTATVDQTGLVTPKKEGTVTIKATSDANSEKYAEISITVSKAFKITVSTNGIMVGDAAESEFTIVSTSAGTVFYLAAAAAPSAQDIIDANKSFAVIEGSNTQNLLFETAVTNIYFVLVEYQDTSIKQTSKVVELKNVYNKPAPTLISTFDQFKAALVAGGTDVTYRLTANIDCTSEITTNGGTFNGVFDGNGYMITNLRLNSQNPGMFKDVGGNAVFKNIIFIDPVVTSANYGAGLLGAFVYSAGEITVDSVTVINLEIKAGNGGVGGLFGQINQANVITVKNSYIESKITGTGGAGMGGIIGLLQGGGALEMTDCEIIFDLVGGNSNGYGAAIGQMDGANGAYSAFSYVSITFINTKGDTANNTNAVIGNLYSASTPNTLEKVFVTSGEGYVSKIHGGHTGTVETAMTAQLGGEFVAHNASVWEYSNDTLKFRLPALPGPLAAPQIQRIGNEISWSAVDNAAGYIVWIKGEKDAQAQEINLLSSELSYTFNETTADTYTIKVMAVADPTSIFTDSGYSNIETIIVADTLAAPTLTVDGHVVRWGNDGNAAGYDVYVNDIKVTATPITDNFYSLASLEIGDYKVEVVAIGDGVYFLDSAKSSPETVSITMSYLDKAEPAVADGSSNKIKADESTIIEWEGVDNATGYLVVINNDTIGAIDVGTATQYSFTNTTLGQYSIKVIAVGDGLLVGNSDPSEAVVILVYDVLSTPVVDVVDNEISWDAVANADKYEVWVNSVLFATINDDGSGDYMVEYTGTTSGTFDVEIIAISNEIYYDNSLAGTAQVTYIAQLDAPMLTVKDDVISWNAVDNATGYVVYVDGVEASVLASGVCEFAFEAAATKADYSITVVAVGDGTTARDSNASTAAVLNVTVIADYDGLKALLAKTGNITGIYQLSADITCTGSALATANNTFNGVLNGRNFKIYDLKMASTQSSVGMFANIGGGAVVKNVVFKDAALSLSDSDGNANGGLLSGNVVAGTTTVDNVIIVDLVIAGQGTYAQYKIGGMFGTAKNSSTIINISNSYIKLSLTAEKAYGNGGVVGLIESAKIHVSDSYIDFSYGYRDADHNGIGGVVGQYGASGAQSSYTNLVIVMTRTDKTGKTTNAVIGNIYNLTAANHVVTNVFAQGTFTQGTANNAITGTVTTTMSQEFAENFTAAVWNYNSGSNELSFVLPRFPAPLAAPVLQKDVAKVSWQSIDDATGYRVFVDDAEVDDYDGISLEYTVSETNAGYYEVKVLAVGDGGMNLDSELSGGITVIITEQLAKPAVTIDSGIISWGNVDHAATYTVYYELKADATGVYEVLAQDVVGLSVGAAGLAVGTYNIVVRAISTNELYTNSELSAIKELEISIVVLEATTVSATATEYTSGDAAVEISWTEVANASVYEVWVNSEKKAEIATTEPRTYAFSSAILGEYQIYIKAVGDGTNYSDNVSLNTITILVYEKLAAPVISGIAGDVVSWDAVSNASGYDVYADGTKLNAALIETESYQITLSAPADYSITVVAVGNGSTYKNSEPSSAKIYSVVALGITTWEELVAALTSANAGDEVLIGSNIAAPAAALSNPVTTSFKGTLNGQGFAITGTLKLTSNNGFFKLDNGAVVKNLTFEKVEQSSGGYGHGVFGTNYSAGTYTLDKVIMKDVLLHSTSSGGFGIFGQVNGGSIVVKDSYFNVKMTSTGSIYAAGGIVGLLQNSGASATVTNTFIKFDLAVSGGNGFGAVVGQGGSGATVILNFVVIDFVNTASISSNTNAAVGNANGATVNGSSNVFYQGIANAGVSGTNVTNTMTDDLGNAFVASSSVWSYNAGVLSYVLL